MHLSRFLTGCVIVAAFMVLVPAAQAQRDSVYLIKEEGQRATKRETGRITEVTPDGVVVESGGRSKTVPVETIRKIVFSGEPSVLDRARERLEDGRFDDSLREIEKITEAPSSSSIQQEIDFYRAAAKSELALRGGTITAKDAGNEISQFLKQYPKSFHFYRASELKAKLLLAIGQPALAEAEYQNIANAKAPQIMLNGLFQLGNTQLLLNKESAAKTTFEKIGRIDVNSPLARQFKVAAACQLAKIRGVSGDTAGAISELNKIIKAEPEENEIVMAYAYNALGACHEKAGDLKQAALAYLHNDLLFPNQEAARAEALYHLSKIFVKLNDPDSANRARTVLLSRYRNSIWAEKL